MHNQIAITTQTKQWKIRVKQQIKLMNRFNNIPNQTGEVIQGNDNDTESNITERAKNIGKNLTEVAKKLDETISKKLHNLAK